MNPGKDKGRPVGGLGTLRRGKGGAVYWGDLPENLGFGCKPSALQAVNM